MLLSGLGNNYLHLILASENIFWRDQFSSYPSADEESSNCEDKVFDSADKSDIDSAERYVIHYYGGVVKFKVFGLKNTIFD